MEKLLIIFLVAGGLCLLIPTAWLVYLNASPRILAPVMSIVAVGIVTTLVTVWTVLKETKKTEVFPSSIIFDTTAKAVPITFGQSTIVERVQDLTVCRDRR